MNETHQSFGAVKDGGTWFQATRWSLILNIGRGDSPQATSAREELCRSYWHAIYGFIRHRGYSVEDAQDLTQDFLCMLLQKNVFQNLDPNIGKFRGFLLTALRNFLANKFDAGQAQKRNPGTPLVQLEDAEQRYLANACEDWNEEMVFDRQWAFTIMGRAMERLRAQRVANGKSELFEALKEFLSREPTDGEYSILGKKFTMQSTALAMAVSRLRRNYRDLITDEILQTVEDEKDVADELRYLVEVVNR